MAGTTLQPNVMAACNECALHRTPFPGMAMMSVYVRLLMITAKRQLRGSDDMRRSNQMAAAQAGDRRAYEALLRDCVPFVKAIARRQGVPLDRCDDVLQDVLLTIHRARHTYDPRRSFTAWLRVITERRAVDLLRRVHRHDRRELHVPLAFEAYPDEGADPARGVTNADASGRVKDALAALPPGQREAVEVLVLKEQSLAEAATETRRSKVALKVNLHRALKALRRKLERTESTP